MWTNSWRAFNAGCRRVFTAELRQLNQFFFQDLNLAANVNDYYDLINSYLNVLRKRRGIPTLAVLWLELATGLGLNAEVSVSRGTSWSKSTCLWPSRLTRSTVSD
jgi:hypothetical protein